MNDRRDFELTSSDKNIEIRPEAVMFTDSSVQSPGAPNDQIFPNTSQVPKMDFCVHKKPVWLIWSCVK